MPEKKPLKLKLCLVGESAVGKTCLIRRFVFDQFDDKYIGTLGTKITKKPIRIKNHKSEEEKDVNLMIWDIMGQQGFRQLLQEAYFFGAQGIIGVCDVTRKNTLSELENWMDAVHSVTREIPIVFLGNKSDLEDDREVDIEDIKDFATRYEKTEIYLSSAKTGHNVELAFKTLGEKILEDIL
ncbi:MAG: GTP-binding protein [Thermoplasmata archaeon]|nr:MAG: GTP-binding protein [Thermoplasmata archaeon]